MEQKKPEPLKVKRFEFIFLLFSYFGAFFAILKPKSITKKYIVRKWSKADYTIQSLLGIVSACADKLSVKELTRAAIQNPREAKYWGVTHSWLRALLRRTTSLQTKLTPALS